MSKVVCPECGGRLTIESLYQYGILRKVKPDGTLCKRTRRRDNGPMEFDYLFCEACGWYAEEEEFAVGANKVELLKEVET